jgi:MFS transporter, CP family, cyanate transporter
LSQRIRRVGFRNGTVASVGASAWRWEASRALYFCLNGFLPAYLCANGREELIGQALTTMNAGQLPASFLLLFAADGLQGKRWPYLALGALFCVCVIGILSSASMWTVFWAGWAGFSCGAALPLSLALAPLLCDNPNGVAPVSAAAFAIAYGFGMLVSLVSGVVWELAGNSGAAFIPIFLGCIPISIAAPKFTRTDPAKTFVQW